MKAYRISKTRLKDRLAQKSIQSSPISLMSKSERADELFTDLYTSSPIGIYILQNGLFVSVNPQFETLIGYSYQELIGTPSSQLIINQDRAMVRDSAVNMLKGFRFAPYEFRVRHKTGKIIWIMESVTPVVFQGQRSTLGYFMDITEKKLTEEALRESEERYRDLFENANDIIYIHDLRGNFISINKKVEITTGFAPEEMLTRNFTEIVAPEYLSLARDMMGYELFHGTFPNYELEAITKDNSRVPLEVRTRLIHHQGRPIAVQGIARDITERKQMENRLRATNRQLLDIIEFLPDATFVIDHEKKVIAWNRAIEEMTGILKQDIVGQGDQAYSIPFYGWRRFMLLDMIGMNDTEITETYGAVTREGLSLYTEVFVPSVFSGRGAYIWVKASPLFDTDGNLVGAIESVRDITERKRSEEQLMYLSMHDPLTGIYNRTYFEEEMHRLDSGRYDPVGLIVCDVDGLKLVNDTLGHDAGDALLIAIANVIKNCFRDGDVVARVGGDEFAILLPNSHKNAAESACRRIREGVFRHNDNNPDILLSVSIGFAVKYTSSISMSELFQEADNNMYREKLHSSQSTRSAIVHTLMKALQVRDFITEGHAARMQNLAVALGQKIGRPEQRITDLRLLAEFHDIGKVGVPDRILFKPGPLDCEEYSEMQRHCEIGHRIAITAQDLVPIADWILKHHEWWNGKGYPLGLKGKDIPLECRIIAIVDAYDAMTNDRPYRSAMSQQEAISELLRFSGLQFDPELVTVFVRMLEAN